MTTINIDKLKHFAKATENDDIYDPDWKGGTWMVGAVETQESIDDFLKSSKFWCEKTTPISGGIAGLPAVCWVKAQVMKGDQHRSISVVDFGNCRVEIDADLSEFIAS